MNNSKKQSRHIQVFTDNCSQCKDHIVNVEVGKCAGCNLEVYSINDPAPDVLKKLDLYDISKHPTTIIDEEIKIEGLPDFYWQCGGEFYDKLRERYAFSVK